MQAPIAKQIDHTWQRPTGPMPDPWAWLRDKDDPDTIAYLQAENAWSDEWFAAHSGTIDTIFEEIKSRVQETDLSAPVRKDDWWYVTRTEEGASYAIHCRGRSADSATAEVLLDENLQAAGHDYFSINAFDVNPQHTLLAWSSDTDGSEMYTMRFRDLATGTDLADELADTTWGGTAWSADGTVLFYVTADEQMRPCTVWRHRVGTPQAADEIVYDEPDERFFVYVDLCRSGEWIIIESASKQSSEVHLVPAGQPDAAPTVVTPRRDDVEYTLDHWGDRWVVLTNLQATDFRLMTAPLADPSDWTELVAHVPGRRITSVEAFAGHLVVHEWADAQPRARILFRDGSERTVQGLPEPHDLELDSNPEWSATTVRYTAQSLTTPLSVYEEDVRTGARTLLKQTPVPGVDLSRYTSERLWATAPDGTRVPVDIVRRTDTVADGTAPLAVYGYGSYEASMPPWFSVARLSLLERGAVWALVHPRGGGELGREWYLQGKLEHKRNTFTDTIACVEHLIAAGWGHPQRVAIRGGSAGGLLVGACVTMRPELFRAAVAEVPFVDVVTTMSDPSLPLTVTEWEEWGDPRTSPAAEHILGYSPYDNTVPAAYPALLITAGLNDPRVSFHEPAKWIAKLRAVRTDDHTLLLRCEMGAGHGGPSGRYEAWRDEARVLTFLLGELA
ncbi:MAG: S9 family peptidase [Actinomycetota bacterium]|nr:S9 family peptidase [Actinomycetota bacterium]